MARRQSTGKIFESETVVIPDTPVGLTVAGSDCCAGAGIQADLKAFTALGVYGLTAITAVVAETPHEVRRIIPMPADFIESQLRLLFDAYPVMAAKTGLLPGSEQIIRIATLLRTWKQGFPQARLVVDPVMVASSDDRLMSRESAAVLEETLLPLADLLTPNRPEAAVLLGEDGKRKTRPREVAEALAEKFHTAILLKGGHADDPQSAMDLLVTENGVTEFSAPRIPGGHTLHGTGCTLSAAITASLAKGAALEEAVADGKAFVTACIQRAHHWEGVSALGLPSGD